MEGNVFIFSAPSGSGKSTIINYLLREIPNLQFSVSATSRPPRGAEKDGVEYFFLSPDNFKAKIEAGEFLEYEEVYPGRFYGTLKAPVDAMLRLGKNVVFDVDVLGACNIKKAYGNRALSIFIMPPSIDELRKRLESRGTESQQAITQRIERAEYELSFASKFDATVINDDIETAQREVAQIVMAFINRQDKCQEQ